MNQRMLVVDDEETILDALCDFFQLRGFTVDCASAIEPAEKLLEEQSYDVVIADLRLTGIDGLEGLELIEFARERSPGSRVLLLTAYGSEAVRREALARGAVGLVQKPIPLPALAEIVDQILKERGQSLATTAR